MSIKQIIGFNNVMKWKVENQSAENFNRNEPSQKNVDLVCAGVVEEPQIYFSEEFNSKRL